MPVENGDHNMTENGGDVVTVDDGNEQADESGAQHADGGTGGQDGIVKPKSSEEQSNAINGAHENTEAPGSEVEKNETKIEAKSETKVDEESEKIRPTEGGGDVANVTKEAPDESSSKQDHGSASVKDNHSDPPPKGIPSGGSGDIKRSKPAVANESGGIPSAIQTTASKSVKDVKRTQHRSKESGSSLKKLKKGIFVSYSPDGSFTERRFVCITVKQFKENSLGEDIWFDKDEQNTDSPAWFSQRMDAVEKCRAAVCFLSESYLQCPVSVYELRSLLERRKSSSGVPPKVFAIRYENVELPSKYKDLIDHTVDLTRPELMKLSLYERASTAIGSLHKEVEACASVHAPYVPPTPERDLTKEYKNKKLCRWTINDVQSWLYDLGIKEFYCQSFLENAIDGFLLMSVMDRDLSEVIGVDSRVARKKILQQIISILEKEHKMPNNWHLRSRTQRSRPDSVYLVYDPADVQLVQTLKQELKKKHLQVTSHTKLGQSKDEFLQINGPQIAAAKHVIIVLTAGACQSPFVFQEVLFADWLGKTLVTAMFKSCWDKLKASLKAILGECPAIDFETRMFPESMDILQHQIKPLRKVPGVVLEQSYLNRMTEGIKSLQIMSSAPAWAREASTSEPKVFISYQWDVHNKVQEIKRILESNHIPCWIDNSPTITHHSHSQQQPSQQRGTSSSSSRSTISTESETMQGNTQRNMRNAILVLCCMTPRYLQSDNCIKDLLLAETLQKPIIPVLLRFIPWPPDHGPSQVKKLLARTSHIDLSNDKLFKQNFHILIDKIRRFTSGKH
ncbi:uncharacterized protein [Amphiura filiformis]|uniref:uncharacterized protein n=1 Tax=Amphiura filiformis TaxID=82378 RepID=UPI003B222775